MKRDMTKISKICSVLVLLITGLAIMMTQWVFMSRRDDNFSVGSPSPETYRVISGMRYDDAEASEYLRSIVENSIVGVTVRDVSAKSRLNYLALLPEGLLNAISKLESEERLHLLNLSLEVGNAVIERFDEMNMQEHDSAAVNVIIWDELNKKSIEPNKANLIYQILIQLGNLSFRVDENLTELAKEYAVDEVPAIERKLEPGDIIVSRGEIITEQIALILRTQGYIEDVFPIEQFCILFIIVIMLPIWLNIFCYGAAEKKLTYWSVVYIIIVAWIFEVFASHLEIHGAGILPAITASYLCIPDYFGFCVSILAATSGVFLITGQSFNNLVLTEVLAIIGSTFGFYILRNLESRPQVTRRAFAMAFILTLSRMCMRFLQSTALSRDSFRLFIPLGEFWQQAGLFFIFEAISTHLVLITLPFIEEKIGTLSILTLREISHPSNSLLRDLQRHAPGTYQHSLTIATLIEAVGIELGMDVNLLRAGAYYHDIGKLRRPQFFVENQGGGFNAHDEMSPMLSAITIISHVKDGLELAWEAKLPRRIRDFISEHHGTTSTRYFYNKAISLLDPNRNLKRQHF